MLINNIKEEFKQMGCAPQPRKSEKIAKTNAQPSMSQIDKENRNDEHKVTKVRFEDLANHDFKISEERRMRIEIEKMDFVNKCQVH